jgi:hypothetical protein
MAWEYIFPREEKIKAKLGAKSRFQIYFTHLVDFQKIHRKPMRAFVNLGEAFRGFDVTLFQKEKALC